MTALLEEFFDHAERDLVAVRDLVPRSFAPIIGGENSLAQIHGESSHKSNLSGRRSNGYEII